MTDSTNPLQNTLQFICWCFGRWVDYVKIFLQQEIRVSPETLFSYCNFSACSRLLQQSVYCLSGRLQCQEARTLQLSVLTLQSRCTILQVKEQTAANAVSCSCPCSPGLLHEDKVRTAVSLEAAEAILRAPISPQLWQQNMMIEWVQLQVQDIGFVFHWEQCDLVFNVPPSPPSREVRHHTLPRYQWKSHSELSRIS